MTGSAASVRHGKSVSPQAVPRTALAGIIDDAVRSGLHCAPYAHETLGTLDKGGTVRISPGYFTTEEEIDACIEAIGIISRGEV